MNESSKTRRIWGAQENSILCGSGIDIGCGPDPITPDVLKFDLPQGDANHITRFIQEQFDFVYSSHCLEHMQNPHAALTEWWKLVKPGGHLIFIVPDEDLYEQGVFPSRFNPDHRATFTIAKANSWSPVSHNVLDLALALPGSELISVTLHDNGYDRRILRHGENAAIGPALRFAVRGCDALRRRGFPYFAFAERWLSRYVAFDQTTRLNVLAQIQCIVRKTV